MQLVRVNSAVWMAQNPEADLGTRSYPASRRDSLNSRNSNPHYFSILQLSLDLAPSWSQILAMAAVYKSLSRPSKKTKPTRTKEAPVNRQRVLLLTSRGVTFRQRHLLNDLYSLLPHSRKDAKLDTKTKLYQLNELAELYNCNNVMFFEARKGKDLYVWMSKAPNGPTVKMHLQNCMLPDIICETSHGS